MNSNIIEIKAVSYATDHGDGSSSISVFPSLEALKEERFTTELTVGTHSYKGYDGKTVTYTIKQETYDEDVKRNAEKWEGAINNESPYDYGYIDENVIIKIKQNEDGSYSLAKSISLDDGN